MGLALKPLSQFSINPVKPISETDFNNVIVSTHKES
jgi:hypothetical protein